MTPSQKTYIVRKGQDAELGALGVTSLYINGVSVVTALLLASGQVIDLNGEADALIMDAAQNVRLDGSTVGHLKFKFSGAYDFDMFADTFKALSGSSILTDTISETTSANGVDIDGLKIKDATLQALKKNVIAKAANFNVATAESGCTYEIGAADVVASLPATAPGLCYRFVLAAAGLATVTGLQVSPQAVDKIMGNAFTAADNKDAILSAATDREGDWIELTGDAAGLGWYITGISGTWARE